MRLIYVPLSHKGRLQAAYESALNCAFGRGEAEGGEGLEVRIQAGHGIWAEPVKNVGCYSLSI